MAAGTSRVLSISAMLVVGASSGAKAATAYVQNDYYNSNTTTNSAGVDIMVAAAPTDTDVPTLPEWGVMLMGSLLLGNMVWMERRKYRR